MAGVGAGSLQRRPQPIFPSRKLASLRTLPRGLAFAGSRGSVQKQFGNAVSSLLAEVMARAIIIYRGSPEPLLSTRDAAWAAPFLPAPPTGYSPISSAAATASTE